MNVEPENLPQEWQRFAGVAAKEYAGMDHARSYALTDTSRLSLGSLMKANGGQGDSAEMRKAFRDSVRRLNKILPELHLLQTRPEDVTLPTIPVDPVSGQPITNPFTTNDIDSQMALSRDHPALFEYFKANKNGPSYKFVAALNKRIAEAKRATELHYGFAEHQQNPHAGGKPGPELTRQLREDRALSQLYEREGKTVRLPWAAGAVNLSQMATIVNRDPQLGAVTQRAATVEEMWAASMQRLAKQMSDDANRMLSEAAGRLRLSSTPAERAV
jgi:hypothetical protein